MASVQLLRPLMAHRAWQPTVQESGWFIGCCGQERNHDNLDELMKVHLVHFIGAFLDLFPYVAMPVGTQLLFENSQVIVFRPGEEEGQVDPGYRHLEDLFEE